MKLPSSQIDRSHSHNPDTDWQNLGELELPLGALARSMLDTWLLDVLTPLHLNAEFLNKILLSAEEIAMRAMHADMLIPYQHTRLLIFIPSNRPLNEQTWGFFRIEKVELVEEHVNFIHNTIEIYLFPEGH